MNENRIEAGAVFSQAWGVFKEHAGPLVLIAFIFALLQAAASLAMGLGNLVITGPLTAGVYVACLGAVVGRRPVVGDLFSGFNFFVPTFLVYLVMTLFATIGFVLCVIPGIVVVMMYNLSYLFVLDKQMDFWPAMEASRKLFFERVGEFVLLYLVEFVIILIGALALGVGVLVALPVCAIMNTLVFKQLQGNTQAQQGEGASDIAAPTQPPVNQL